MVTDSSYWQQVWDSVQPRLRAWKDPVSFNTRVTRVGQQDVELLDDELVLLLQEPLYNAVSLVNTSLRAKFEPELALIIRLTLYKFSIWEAGASYGAKLQDLRYRVLNASGATLSPSGIPRRTLVVHAALTVLIPYLHNRLRRHALSHSWPDAPSADRRRKAWNILTRVESTHTLLALVNFVIFLFDGKHRTLADRLLSMRLAPSRRLTSREVSYEFMNRQMVWHAFTEFLLFILPIFNTRVVRRVLNRIVSRVRSPAWSSIFPSSVPSTLAPSGTSPQGGKDYSLSLDQCAICAENASYLTTLPLNSHPIFFSEADRAASDEAPLYPIGTPYQIPCGHIYCFYCISDRLIHSADDGEDGWECLRCGEVVRSCERVTRKEASEDAKSSDGWDSEDEIPSFSSDISLESEVELESSD